VLRRDAAYVPHQVLSQQPHISCSTLPGCTAADRGASHPTSSALALTAGHLLLGELEVGLPDISQDGLRGLAEPAVRPVQCRRVCGLPPQVGPGRQTDTLQDGSAHQLVLLKQHQMRALGQLRHAELGGHMFLIQLKHEKVLETQPHTLNPLLKKMTWDFEMIRGNLVH
jgi:hypothetical protein